MNKKALITLYHVLLSRAGMSADDGHQMLMDNYGVEHSNELTIPQLQQICGMLKKGLGDPKPEPSAKNKLQRTVKASCGNLLALQGKIPPKNWGPKDWDVIMGTIHNASGKKEFQSLTTQELRALSFEFNKQRKALEALQAPKEEK